MQLPLQITFRNMPPSPAARARIRTLFERLDTLHPRIMSCRVTVRAPHRRHHKGRLYHVSVDVKVPGREIAVNRDPSEHHAHEDINVAARDAFNAVARRLQDAAREFRGDVKAHEGEPHGRIASLFSNYGFIANAGGDEVYFHANAVPGGGFRQLQVGQDVRYSAEIGEKGLQATVVKPAGKHRMAT